VIGGLTALGADPRHRHDRGSSAWDLAVNPGSSRRPASRQSRRHCQL